MTLRTTTDARLTLDDEIAQLKALRRLIQEASAQAGGGTVGVVRHLLGQAEDAVIELQIDAAERQDEDDRVRAAAGEDGEAEEWN